MKKTYKFDLTFTAKLTTYAEVDEDGKPEDALDAVITEVLNNELLDLDEVRFTESKLELDGAEPVEE